jgi:DNA-binding MarR family transcriptional regulator
MSIKTIEVITTDTTKPTAKKRSKNSSAYEFCLAHTKSDRLLRTIFSDTLSAHDLSIMEWLLLGVVSLGPEDGLAMNIVAQELDVTMPQTTAIIDKLIKRRLLRQKTQREDRRSRHVLLTANGRLAYKNVERDLGNVFDRYMNLIPQNYFVFYRKVIELMSQISR